jgi:hypothetical protein
MDIWYRRALKIEAFKINKYVYKQYTRIHKMAYKVKHRKFKDFRHEFPQLCAAAQAPEPLDFSILKYVEEVVVKPVEGLPPGWINVRTYVKPEEPELDAHTLMYRCAQKLLARWEKWNREHDIYVDYSYEDDVEDDVSDNESESSYAEDPEDEWSD